MESRMQIFSWLQDSAEAQATHVALPHAWESITKHLPLKVSLEYKNIKPFLRLKIKILPTPMGLHSQAKTSEKIKTMQGPLPRK